MRTRSVNKVEEEMTFLFYAPKEDNEVEEDDERFFLENMRSRSINEGEEEKLYVLLDIHYRNVYFFFQITFFPINNINQKEDKFVLTNV